MFPAGICRPNGSANMHNKEDSMQVQNELNNYELYSTPAPSARKLSKIMNKKSRKIIYTIAVFVLFVSAVCSLFMGANYIFDRCVFADTPDYSMKSPEYSARNAVFANVKQKVTLSLFVRGGNELVISSDPLKLSEVLNNEEIELDDTCVLNYSLDTIVYEGMEVVIDSVTYENVDVTTPISYDVTTVEVQTIPKGTKNVLTKGQDGSLVTTYRKKYVNGQFDSEEAIAEKTVQEPITEVVELGIGGQYVGKDGVTYNYSYYLDVVATCYGPSDGTTGTITATGTKAREGIIAVDPKTIPLGSKVYVTSSYRDLGVLTAEDTGGFIKGNRIDVYLNGTLQELLQFGRRDMRVYIIE